MQFVYNLYIIFYRQGTRPDCSKIFYCEDGFAAAQERAKLHCKRMNFGYYYTKRLVYDLETEENNEVSRRAQGAER